MKRTIVPLTGKLGKWRRRAHVTPIISSGLNGAVTVALMTTLGCTHMAKSRAKAKHQLEEQSRALTTAVVDTLQLEPPEDQNEESALALRLAREDQRIEGLPNVPIPVEPLLGIFPSNMPPAAAERAKEKASAALEARFGEIEKLLQREHAAEERLEQFGETYEAEKNERRVRWLKIFGSGSLLLGAVVALCVFVPAAIPILGRILAWAVGKVPALAGAMGVVSVKAFDAVVKGVERTKASSPEPSATSLGNERFDPVPAPDSLLHDLHLNFSREMDAEHKALVRTRKGALGL